MSDQITRAWIGLWLQPKLGPKTILSLVEAFGSMESLINADPMEINQRTGLHVNQAEQIALSVKSEAVDRELEEMDRFGVELIHWEESTYPTLLREIDSAPPVIYHRGTLNLNDGLPLAFVGSRKASFAGKNQTKRIIHELSQAHKDIRVVSGLALGIDTAAHEGALEAGLATIAVLAGGLSSLYPKQNWGLADDILNSGGMLLTEFPMLTSPLPAHFPLRNRIISGLSHGVVVAEAGERSGTSITANYALDQGRELFAFPGPMDSKFHVGVNRLIQRGSAKLTLCAKDILEEIHPDTSFEKTHDKDPKAAVEAEDKWAQLEPREKMVMTTLEEGGLTADALAQKLGSPIHELLAILTTLEMQGLIYQQAGAKYQVV